VVGLPQFFLRHFDELGLGVVVGLQVLQAVWQRRLWTILIGGPSVRRE